MKHFLLILLGLLLAVSNVAFADGAVPSYTSDDGFYYNLYSDGTATLTYCTATGEIVIPETITVNGETYTVTVVGNGATIFQSGSAVTSITIPNTVLEIGSFAFYGLTSITEIVIPDSVTTLGIDVFNGCTSLEKIVFGTGLTNIGDWEFTGCTSLQTIIVKAENPPYIDNQVFANFSNSGYTVYIPADSWDDYMNFVDHSGRYSWAEILTGNGGTGSESESEGGVSGGNEEEGGEGGAGENGGGNNYNDNEGGSGSAGDGNPHGATIEDFVNGGGEVPATDGTKGLDESYTALPSILAPEATEVARYNLLGQKISQPQKGVNIIILSDGSTQKVLVK